QRRRESHHERTSPPPSDSSPRETPTADEAPTGRFRTPPPQQGARSHPPQQPPGGRETGYERYNTAGYPSGERTTASQPTDHTVSPESPESPEDTTDERAGRKAGQRVPRKMTVTRVAALRGRELSGQAVDVFQRAAKADGADRSGLTSLTYAVMLNYASDAAMAVALANTLFFAATTGESRGRVALYLVITLAPFALVAPVIGPTLDKIQRGRRV